MKLKDRWNKNKFSVYQSEEKTVLRLIQNIYNWLSNFVDEIDNKTDSFGDHKGSWQGINKPTLSDEGMRGTVEKLDSEVKEHDKQIDKISFLVSDFKEYVINNDWAYAINEGLKCAIENNGVLLLDGVYDIYSTVEVPTNSTLKGYGFSWGGKSSINVKKGGIIALSIKGVGINIEDICIKCDARFTETTHGLIQDSSEGWHSFNNYKNIRIINFNGTGIKFDSCHDSLIENISVEMCGNLNNYAFEVTSTNDTTNHCVFNRIQVEQSYNKAIKIDNKVMSCNFTNIHSERTLSGDGYTHELQGYISSYDNVRIQNSTELKNKVLFGGANNKYQTMTIDGESTFEYGVRSTSIIENCFFDRVITRAICTPIFTHCSITELSITSESVKVEDSTIGKINGYESQGLKEFNNNKIENLNVASTNFNNCKFINCTISNNIEYNGADISFEMCKLKDVNSTYCQVNIKFSELNNFHYDGNGYGRLLFNNYIKGNVTRGGTGDIVAFGNYVSGNDFIKYSENDKISSISLK